MSCINYMEIIIFMVRIPYYILEKPYVQIAECGHT